MKRTLQYVNRGIGAGGCNTNKNGLSYEILTDLRTNYVSVSKKNGFNVIKFSSFPHFDFIEVSKTKLKKYMKFINEFDDSVEPAHGCKQPDEIYVCPLRKKVFIIEKKFQQCSGSVCEKIQTAEFKKEHFKREYPRYSIEYIYCLSDWFKHNCKAELYYLEKREIPVFFGSDKNYKNNIINFMCNFESKLP